MQKTINRFLSAVVCTAMVSTTALAAESSVRYDAGSITINCDIEDSGYGTFMYILKGKLPKDGKVSELLSTSTLMYAGPMTDSFDLPTGAADGVYTVVLGSDAFTADAERSFYALKADNVDVSAKIKEVFAATDAESMFQKLSDNNDTAYILDLTNANGMKQLFYDLVKDGGYNSMAAPTVDDLEAVFANAEDLYAMTTETDAESLAAMIKENKTFFGEDDDLDEYADEVARDVLAAVNGGALFNSVDAQKRLVREKLALNALNGCGSAMLYETIEKYNDVFNIIWSSNKNNVSEYEVKKALPEFTAASDVASAVNNAIDTIYRKNNQNSNGLGGLGGGGGIGGGGGGGYVAPSVADKEQLSTSVGEDTSYADTEGYEWAKDAMDKLNELGIMTGDGNGSFRPADNITREELVKIIIEAVGDGMTDTYNIKFTDVAEDAWYRIYVETAVSRDIVNGIDKETFGTGAYATREDFCVMIVRAAESYYKKINAKTAVVSLTDIFDAADYAQEAVDTLARAQIVNGYEDDTFRPKNTITRAEAAKVIYNCLLNFTV